MSALRLKEKLSTLVPDQLPEFIKTDYTTFVAFLEAYYQFLEQDQSAQELLQNARSYRDVDTTVDSFVEYFLKQYCADLPRSAPVNKRQIVKQIKDLYNYKGSEKSYKLLFQLIFKKTPEFFYPNTQVLKTSDGKWIQQVSIYVKTIVGDPDSVAGKVATVISNNNKALVNILQKRYAIGIDPDSSTQEITTRTNLFEFVIDNSKNVPIEIGDVIEYAGYRGIVQGVPSVVKVLNSGTGFRVGDVFQLTTRYGRNTAIKAKKVSSDGRLLIAEFIRFGINYNEDFYAYISSTDQVLAQPSFLFGAGSVSLTDNTTGFSEVGDVIVPTYSITAFEGSYAGDVIRSFVSDSRNFTGGGLGEGADAFLLIQAGAKARYPGYYKNNDGFISDDIYLENADYYQPFSYVLKIDEQLSNYKKAVLDILHPAGLKMFSDYSINNSFNLLTQVTTTLRFLTSQFEDRYTVTDIDAKVVNKNSVDTAGTLLHNRVKIVTRGIERELVVPSDAVVKTTTRPIANNISTVGVTLGGLYRQGAKFIRDYYSIDAFEPEYSAEYDKIMSSDLINITKNSIPV
jgi:hypothetical protein